MEAKDTQFVFITGASGGLGKAFAVECANRGWNLFLTDLTPESLDKLADSLTSTYGITVEHQACDLLDRDSRSKLFSTLKEKSSSFLGIINVAGVDYEGAFFERSRQEVLTLLRINVEALVELIHETVRYLIVPRNFTPKRHHSFIINVSSLAAFYPMPHKALYAASKRFILDFSLALGEELRYKNCTVTALCPAGLPTTFGAIQGIEAQGLMGQITTKNIGYVASATIDAALKGKRVFIPGRINRLIRRAGSLLPIGLVVHLIGNRWETARS